MKRFSKHAIVTSRLYLFIVSWLSRIFFSLLYYSLKIEFRGQKSLPRSSIIMLWHEKLLLAPLVTWRFRKKHFTVVVSKSRDGKLLSAFSKTYPNVTTIDVGHLERRKALVDMCQALNSDTAILITPDGPRGPRRKLKPGLDYVAKKTNAPIFYLEWHAEKVWTFNTWDKMQCPKPFSKVFFTISEVKNLKDVQ